MLLFCMLLKKENCHDPKTSECLRCEKHEAARPWKHGSAYKTRKYRELTGLRARPVQVPCVLHSKVRTSHCPRWEAGARTFLGDHSDPDNPSCSTQMQVRLLKIIDAALFTKGVGPGLVLPARPSDSHREVGGGWGVPAQSWWARPGQPHVGVVLPPGALMGLLPRGSRVGSRCQHCCLRKALSALGSPGRTAGRGRPGAPNRSPGGGPGR